MEAHLDTLNYLAAIVSICKTGANNPEPINDIEDAAAFFRDHCYYPDTSELRAVSEDESACYEGSAATILKCLSRLPFEVTADSDVPRVGVLFGLLQLSTALYREARTVK